MMMGWKIGTTVLVVVLLVLLQLLGIILSKYAFHMDWVIKDNLLVISDMRIKSRPHFPSKRLSNTLQKTLQMSDL